MLVLCGQGLVSLDEGGRRLGLTDALKMLIFQTVELLEFFELRLALTDVEGEVARLILPIQIFLYITDFPLESIPQLVLLDQFVNEFCKSDFLLLEETAT